MVLTNTNHTGTLSESAALMVPKDGFWVFFRNIVVISNWQPNHTIISNITTKNPPIPSFCGVFVVFLE